MKAILSENKHCIVVEKETGNQKAALRSNGQKFVFETEITIDIQSVRSTEAYGNV